MILRDFRIGWRICWRLLLKEPGLAVCFQLLGFVRYCFTCNAQIPGSEHIFVVKERRHGLPQPDFSAAALALRN
jgi:putative ABC transport system permease protein